MRKNIFKNTIKTSYFSVKTWIIFSLTTPGLLNGSQNNQCLTLIRADLFRITGHATYYVYHTLLMINDDKWIQKSINYHFVELRSQPIRALAFPLPSANYGCADIGSQNSIDLSFDYKHMVRKNDCENSISYNSPLYKPIEYHSRIKSTNSFQTHPRTTNVLVNHIANFYQGSQKEILERSFDNRTINRNKLKTTG